MNDPKNRNEYKELQVFGGFENIVWLTLLHVTPAGVKTDTGYASVNLMTVSLFRSLAGKEVDPGSFRTSLPVFKAKVPL